MSPGGVWWRDHGAYNIVWLRLGLVALSVFNNSVMPGSCIQEVCNFAVAKLSRMELGILCVGCCLSLWTDWNHVNQGCPPICNLQSPANWTIFQTSKLGNNITKLPFQISMNQQINKHQNKILKYIQNPPTEKTK